VNEAHVSTPRGNRLLDRHEGLADVRERLAEQEVHARGREEPVLRRKALGDAA
jgi:hypothetical protein